MNIYIRIVYSITAIKDIGRLTCSDQLALDYYSEIKIYGAQILRTQDTNETQVA